MAQLASSEEWPALLQTVCGYVSVGDIPARTAMFILAQLPEYAPNVIISQYPLVRLMHVID